MVSVLHPSNMAPTERGQGLVEYAMVLVIVSIALVGSLTVLGGVTNNGLYSQILNTMAQVP